MGERHIIKSVGTLDHIKQRNDASLRFYMHFNKELVVINQVIIGGETIRVFVRAIGCRGSTLSDSLSVILINTVEEIHEGKKRHPLWPQPNREIYETFTLLNQKI